MSLLANPISMRCYVNDVDLETVYDIVTRINSQLNNHSADISMAFKLITVILHRQYRPIDCQRVCKMFEGHGGWSEVTFSHVTNGTQFELSFREKTQ